MSRFIYEPDEKLAHGHVVELRTARDVLRHLGVHEAGPATQGDAVYKWLKENEPDEFLQMSLDRMGLPVKPHSALQGEPSITEVLPYPAPASFVAVIRIEPLWQSDAEVSQETETVEKGAGFVPA